MTRARTLSRLANATVLTVDGSNNVGVGSTIPDAKLDVIGIVSATSFYGSGSNLTGVTASGLTGSPNITINNLVGVAATFSGVVTYEDVTNIDSVGIITAQSYVSIADSIVHTGDIDTSLRFPANDTITAETAGSEAIRVDSSQRLLVNTTGAMETFGSAALQVATSAGGTLVLGREDSSVSADNGLGAIYFDTYAGGAWAETAIIAAEADANQGTDDYPSRLVFKTTADGAASATEKLRITSAGKVGIGTDNPGEKLHLTTTSGNCKLRIDAASAASIDFYNSGTRIADMFTDASTSNFTITNRQNADIIVRTNGTNEKLRITSAGHTLPGADDTYDLGSATKRWANIYSADLQLSNEGAANEVDGTWGQYTIQEGEDNLFLINRRNGKKYKFMLQEVN